jgi:3',5'-cyclic AMP phosphodiesterase CpdA
MHLPRPGVLRLAHLSDVHAFPQPALVHALMMLPGSLMSKRATGLANLILRRRGHHDCVTALAAQGSDAAAAGAAHAAVTGDLANIALRREFGLAATALADFAMALEPAARTWERRMAAAAAANDDDDSDIGGTGVGTDVGTGVGSAAAATMDKTARVIANGCRAFEGRVMTVIPGNHDRYVAGVEGHMEQYIRPLLGDNVATGRGKDGSGVGEEGGGDGGRDWSGLAMGGRGVV